MGQNAQVLVLKGGTIPSGATIVQYVLRNTTAHFRVSYDNALGAAGPILADAMLATCEADLSAMVAFFGVSLPAATIPINVFIDVGSFGAYHGTCQDTGLHCAAFAGNDSDLVRFVMVAELSECFMAATGKWDCGSSSGEGLSRVMATERYPAELDGFATAPTWLDGARPNWVDNTEPTDRSYESTGCAALFLNFLHHQLNYSWKDIIAAGKPTLSGTYSTLSGKTDAWVRFSTLVASKYPAGTPSGVTTDNIFPIIRVPPVVRPPLWQRMAWLWIIIIGGIIIWPGGVGCIVCGSPLNARGDIGRLITLAIGALTVLVGLAGLITNRSAQD